ncbi:Hypothetical protein UVM_LOCUS265 [uncultured virus]|nr:Hypothetical protein UVM_LOCUS265 [uncultured virus]
MTASVSEDCQAWSEVWSGARHNITMFWIPKCACTTLRRAFAVLHYDVAATEPLSVAMTAFLSMQTVRRPGQNFALNGFIVLRDPVDRAISMFANVVANRAEAMNIASANVVQFAAERQLPLSFRTFVAHLDQMQKNGWVGCDPHFIPQALFVARDKLPHLHIIMLHRDVSELAGQLKNVYHSLLNNDHQFDAAIDATCGAPSNTTAFGESVVVGAADLSKDELNALPLFPDRESFLKDDAIREALWRIYSCDYALIREFVHEDTKKPTPPTTSRRTVLNTTPAWQRYFETYPDLLQNGLRYYERAARMHFRRFGKSEGRTWPC